MELMKTVVMMSVAQALVKKLWFETYFWPIVLVYSSCPLGLSSLISITIRVTDYPSVCRPVATASTTLTILAVKMSSIKRPDLASFALSRYFGQFFA